MLDFSPLLDPALEIMGPLRTPSAQVKKLRYTRLVIILPLGVITSEMLGYSKRCECGNADVRRNLQLKICGDIL